MRLGIIGLGLIGGSIAKGLKKRKAAWTLCSLQKEEIIDVVHSSLDELVRDVDLLILSCPLSKIIEVAEAIEKVPREKNLIVIDVGSVKRMISKAFEKLSTPQILFLPTHPVAGKEKSGFEESDPDLFQGASWIITPHQKTEKHTLEAVEKMIHSLGAHVVYLQASEHDEHMALVSHLPALLSKEYHDFVEARCVQALEVAGPGFHSFTRLAHDNPQMQSEIRKENQDHLNRYLDEWVWDLLKKRKRKISPSQTVRMNDLAKGRTGKTYNFSAGDPLLPIHPRIREGAKQAISSHESAPYPPVAGIPALREAAASWMKNRYAVEETLVTAGGKFALYALLASYLSPGDEVLLPSPYWVSYLPMIETFYAKARLVNTSEEKGWKVTTDDLKKAYTPKTSLLLLNSGCNPTGCLYTKEELEALLAWAHKKGVFVLSDEVYSEMVYDGKSYVSCSEFQDYREGVAVVQSCSKNFGMTGWRVGFAFAPRSLIESATTLQGQTTTGASLISQWAALSALQHADEISRTVREEMCKRRDLFSETFHTLFGLQLDPVPSALYQFISLEKWGVSLDSKTFCEKALQEAGVAMVPGSAFGQEGYVRMAFSEREENIVEGLQTLHQFCRRDDVRNHS